MNETGLILLALSCIGLAVSLGLNLLFAIMKDEKKTKRNKERKP